MQDQPLLTPEGAPADPRDPFFDADCVPADTVGTRIVAGFIGIIGATGVVFVLEGGEMLWTGVGLLILGILVGLGEWYWIHYES